MKKEWKKCLKTIGVFTLSATLLFETALNGVITAVAAEDEVLGDEKGIILNNMEPQSVSGPQAEPENTPAIDVNENLYTVMVNNGVSPVYEAKFQVGSTPVLETPVKEDNREMGTGFQWKYFFEKWIYTDAAGNEVTDFTQVSADAVITATAQFRDEKQTFFWTLDWNNGSEVQNCGEYPVGREIVLPPAEVVVRDAEEANGIRTEYTFEKWSIADTEGTEYAALSEVPAGKIVAVKAVYQEKTTEIGNSYTVKVDNGNGDDIYEVSVPVGEKPVLADLPDTDYEVTKETSTGLSFSRNAFCGWEFKNENGEIVDPASVKAGETITVSAVWRKGSKYFQTYFLRVDEGNDRPEYFMYVPVGKNPMFETYGNSLPYVSSQASCYNFIKFDDKHWDIIQKSGDEGQGWSRLSSWLPNPKKDREIIDGQYVDYTFYDWEFTDENGNKIDPKSATVATIVYAKAIWTETRTDRTYIWDLDYDNGSEIVSNESRVGETITLPSAEEVVKETTVIKGVRTEYAFDKWVITDEEGMEYNELAEVSEGKHVLVKVHYKETKTEIYRLTTITGNGTDSTREFPVGTLPSMPGEDLPPLTKPTTTNFWGHEITHTFNGWLYTVYSEEYPDGKEITYEDIQNVVKGSVVVAEAQWIDEEQTYWLSVDLDSTSPANPSYVPVLCKVGEDIIPCGGYIPVKDTIVANNVRTEYTFEKWVITDDEGNGYEKLADVKAGKNVIAKAVYAEKKTNIGITNPQPSTPNPSQPSTTEPEVDDTTQNPTMPVRDRRNDEEPLADTLVPPVEEAEPERDLVHIEDEETPLDDGLNRNEDENGSQNEEVVLEDEEVPLSDMSSHDGCFIHWIMLLLSIAYLVYASVRIADRKQKIDELKKNTLTVKK